MWIQVVHFVPKKSKQCKWSVVTNVEIRRVWHLDLVTYWCESWIIYDLGWPVERWVKGGFVFESWLCYKGHFDGNNTGLIIQSSFVLVALFCFAFHNLFCCASIHAAPTWWLPQSIPLPLLCVCSVSGEHVWSVPSEKPGYVSKTLENHAVRFGDNIVGTCTCL